MHMEELKHIVWFGHAGFMLTDTNGNRIYYIDPFQLPKKPLEKADMLFITHAHPDHLSPHDLKPLLQEDTSVIAPIDCIESLHLTDNQQYPVMPHEEHIVKGVEFITLPAYNTHKDRLSFHPKSKNWVGYVLTLNGKKIYHAGDTDFIPEMETLHALHIDIALLPIGGTYTMDVEQAAHAANTIGAKMTIPMHYKMLLEEKTKEAEETFQNLVTNSKVVFLEEVK
jgi:L-ascorbate metabolism protein UlaG (beta-lactamase superfamily)